MSIPGSAVPFLLAQQPQQYQIERSLRFNSADSAHLSRTPSVAGNRKTWTYAFWAKLSYGNTDYFLRNVNSGNNDSGYIQLSLSSLGDIRLTGWATNWFLTAPLFRDAAAWAHCILAVDTTQTTEGDRIKFYVNGVQVTQFSTFNAPALNFDLPINATAEHDIGVTADYYLADIHFIDGQALTPTSFGEFDTNGVWQPKAYSGTYGTNGFHLPFSDNSTAAALGTDTSGAGNNWTIHNISVAAGAGNDSLVETPTSYGVDDGMGGSVRGNYATFNPLALGGGTLSNGNLDVASAVSHATRNSTIGVSSGKWYAEFNLSSANVCGLGITSRNTAYTTWPDNSAGNYWFYYDGGVKYLYPGGGASSSNAGAPATGIWKIALDLDNGKCWIGTGSIWYDSAWNQTGNPSTGVNPTFSSLPAATYFMFVETHTVVSWTANFGQRQWAYAAPAGFKALCATNLPEPQTITTSGSYTGNGVQDGPFVYLNGVPTAMTISGNPVTFGTEADKLSNGFKIRTNNVLYNQNAVVYNYSITSTGNPFKIARAQSNP